MLHLGIRVLLVAGLALQPTGAFAVDAVECGRLARAYGSCLDAPLATSPSACCAEGSALAYSCGDVDGVILNNFYTDDFVLQQKLLGQFPPDCTAGVR